MRNEYMSWSREQFDALPFRGTFDTPVNNIESIILLPSNELHDSGFAVMDFVAVVDGVAKCRLSGCSDALDIIGGGRWAIDLMPNGFFRLFCHFETLKAGAALSSFSIKIQ